MGGQEACMGKVRNAYKVCVEKPEGKIPLRRSRRRVMNIIKYILEK
jgi:hypothetical protein